LALCSLALLSTAAQAQFGWVIYSGQASADVYLGKLTDPSYSRVEFYRANKKLGEITLNGPDGGIVTDYGLAKGSPYNYEFRAWRSTGGYLQATMANGFVIGGELWGILTRKDSITQGAQMMDSIWVFPGGTMNFGYGPVQVPGGDLHLSPGADVTYNVSMSGKISGIKIFDTNDPQYPPGKFTSHGGTLKDVNIECWGQVGPISQTTFVASDVRMYSDYPCVMNNCTLTFLLDMGRNDYAYFDHKFNRIRASYCIVKNESQILGGEYVDHSTFDYDGICSTIQAEYNTFKNNGQLMLRPSGVATAARYNVIQGGTSSSSMSIANQSVVQFNTFEPGTLLTVSSIAGGFDPADVAGIHINYNDFQRQGMDASLLSTRDVDTIDATKNYWGQCTGPYMAERLGRAAHFDPYLRVKYPATSYWFDIGPNKKTILANGEDEVIFSGHFYNTLEGVDSAGATVNYLVRCLGDTLQSGILTMDANGMCTLSIKVPLQYASAIALEVYFTSIQCIDQGFIITVSEPEGPDLSIYDAIVVQNQDTEKAIIAHKPFVVKTIIQSTEAETTPFKVHVRVNQAVYDTFYVNDKNNRSVQYTMKNALTQISLPKNETPTLLFFINNDSLAAGTASVEVVIDPPDDTHPKGLVEESNDWNNTFTVPFTLKETAWANDGGNPCSIFVQPFDGYPFNGLDRLTRWTDTTLTFIESCWPLNKGQLQFSQATQVEDYSWIHPDTLRVEDWEHYLIKAYKQMRMAHPAFDRYVFAVDRSWFETRLHPVDFDHKLSQTISWSGAWDLTLVSNQSFQYLTHSLGHSFGLRRGDLASDSIDSPNLIDLQEEYYNFFIGKEVYDAYDPPHHRLIHYGLNNEVGRLMKAYCFMGNVKLPNEGFMYYPWICDVDYNRLIGGFAQLRPDGGGLHKGIAPKAMFIEGSVDSATIAFSLGPWVRLDNATASSMMDSALATHVFRFLDGSNAEVSRYYYNPTFTALGLDEAADAPHMATEYFGFVVPFPDNVKRVVVETNGVTVAERMVSNNPPVPDVTYPSEGQYVPEGGSFTATWTASDPDGDTEFWYTVYFSSDKGATWKLITFESKDVSANIKAPKGMDYKLRVIASDGINTSEMTRTFNIATGAETPVAPGDPVLYQNYPNPFNPSTLLRYSLPAASHVKLEVVDALGRPVATLVDAEQPAGLHAVSFDAAGRPSGTYFAVLRAANTRATIRMVLSK
jgi:hypothetical protein